MPVMGESEVAEEQFVSAGERVGKQRESVTPELTAARLAMMRQVQQVIRNGLRLLGISAPDRM
jgi:arginyl-tRNA synthetase